MFREEDGNPLQYRVSIIYANSGMSLLCKTDIQDLPKDDPGPLTFFKTDMFECIRHGRVGHFLSSD